MDPLSSPLVILVVSLLPGVLGSALKLRLDPEADDETLLASSQKAQPWSALVFWICVIWILVAAGRQTVNYLFLVPLTLGLYFALWIGRRRLLKERWSFPSYLGFVLRFLVGFAGPPVLLIVTPALVLMSSDVPTAGVVAVVVLLVIFHSYHRILPWVLGCRAWQPDDELAKRFREIEQRSELDVAPQKSLIPVRAGLVYNAFAVTHTERPGVLFTSALADDFPDDQLAGIHAHEVSHLEQFRRPRVRWTLEIAVLLLILGAGLGVPLSSSGSEEAWWVYVLWVILILVLLFLRGRWAHGLESQADQRAADLLGGDGESLAAGLEELHKRQRMPRRLSADVESRMTHPSLARRLQAIRRLSGHAAVRPETGGTFLSPDGTSALVFGAERLHRLDDLPTGGAVATPADPDQLKSSARTSRSDAYGALTELHLVRDRKGRPRISGSSAAGKPWSRPLREDDVQRANAWLDAVDGEFAEIPKQPLAGPRTWRLLGVLSIVLSIATWGALPAVVLCSVFLLATGHRAAAAALGACLVGAIFVLVRSQVVESFLPGVLFWILLAIFIASALLLFTSIVSRRAREDREDGPVWPAAGFCLALGIAEVVIILMISWTSSGLDLFSISDAVARLPSAWILLLAGGAAMATRRSRSLRTTAALLTAGAALLALLSLAPIRQILAPDPLDSTWTPEPAEIGLVEVDRWSVPLAPTSADVHVTGARVSPDRSWIAGKAWSRSEDDPHTTKTTWVLTPRDGSAGSQIRLSDGDFEFLGPSAGVHRAIGREPALVYLDLAAGERTPLPIGNVFFDLASHDGQWHLVGYDEWSHDSEFVRLSGDVESFRGGEVHRVAYAFPHGEALSEDAYPSGWSFVGDQIVFIESRWRNGTFWLSLAHSLGLRTIEKSTLLLGRSPDDSADTGFAEPAVEPLLTTRLDLACPTQNSFSPDLFCFARDRDLTRLVRVGLDSPDGASAPEVLATLHGESWAFGLQSAGGWTLFETGWQDLVWQRGSGRVFRLPETADHVHGASWTLMSSDDSEPLLASLDPGGEVILYEFVIPLEP